MLSNFCNIKLQVRIAKHLLFFNSTGQVNKMAGNALLLWGTITG